MNKIVRNDLRISLLRIKVLSELLTEDLKRLLPKLPQTLNYQNDFKGLAWSAECLLRRLRNNIPDFIDREALEEENPDDA